MENSKNISFNGIKYGLHYRLVNEGDADFIFKLRTDPELSKFISKVDGAVEDQIAWIKRYKEREKLGEEYYFIFENTNQKKLGVDRLYNFDETSFELGSWLFEKNESLSLSAMKGDLISKDIAFEQLGFINCRFEVRKNNAKVVKYHLGFNSTIVSEDDLNYYFILSYANYIERRERFLKMIKRRDNI